MQSLLSTADAAKRLRVTPAAVRLMVHTGRLPIAARTPGGICLYHEEVVDALAARRADQAQYLRAAEAAHTLGVTPAAVRSMARAGRLPVAHVGDRGIRLYRRSDVEGLAVVRRAGRTGA